MNLFFWPNESIHFQYILSFFPRDKEINSKAVAELIPGLGLRFVQIRGRSDGPLHITRVVNFIESDHHAQGVEWIHCEVLDCLSLSLRGLILRRIRRGYIVVRARRLYILLF